MPASQEPEQPQRPQSGAREPRRPSSPPRNSARLDEVFGQILPETTSDEREHESSGTPDDWYLDNRPPHH